MNIGSTPFARKAALALAMLLAGCASPADPQALTPQRIKDACTKAEMPAALEKFKDKGAEAGENAAFYVHLICGFVANNCSKEPGAPNCQRDLRRYGLLP